MPVRVVTPSAWHSLFARNMFIRPPHAELNGFQPAFTILHAPEFHSIPELDGIRSETFIFVNFAERLVLIGGTRYAGEIKKCVFGYLNFVLPTRDVLPMHCSANVGSKGDSAIFFGLSGTGKTTLSADASRTLIGDDEHGWSPRGLFNFEGGCYAKVINLSPKAEPEIYATITRFGTVLENVVMNPRTRMPDVDDGSLTENTRACYPLDYIPNASDDGLAPHPQNVIMLTCDAFGVMPPIAQLNAEQAMYHFSPSYCRGKPGNSAGLGSEPQATFSTCCLARRPSCAGRPNTPRCSATASPNTGRNAGWSTPVGQAAPTAPASAWRSATRVACCARCSTAASPTRRCARTRISASSCPRARPTCRPMCSTRAPAGRTRRPGSWTKTARGLTRDFARNFSDYEPYVDEGIKRVALRAA